MGQVQAYDNSPRLFYDMECYGVDMCIVQPAGVFGMTNEINVEQMKKHPDKIACNCFPNRTKQLALAGEIEGNIDEVCQELDELLSTGDYVGIGEGVEMGGWSRQRSEIPTLPDDNTLLGNMMKILEICRKHKVPTVTIQERQAGILYLIRVHAAHGILYGYIP